MLCPEGWPCGAKARAEALPCGADALAEAMPCGAALRGGPAGLKRGRAETETVVTDGPILPSHLNSDWLKRGD